MCGVVGSVSLGFLADAFGRKTATMLFYLMCLILTPVVYLRPRRSTSCCSASACSASSSWGSGPGRRYGSPIPSRPECVGPRSLQCTLCSVASAGPPIAGTLIVALGGYGLGGDARPIVLYFGVVSFYLLGFLVAPFVSGGFSPRLPRGAAGRALTWANAGRFW